MVRFLSVFILLLSFSVKATIRVSSFYASKELATRLVQQFNTYCQNPEGYTIEFTMEGDFNCARPSVELAQKVATSISGYSRHSREMWYGLWATLPPALNESVAANCNRDGLMKDELLQSGFYDCYKSAIESYSGSDLNTEQAIGFLDEWNTATNLEGAFRYGCQKIIEAIPNDPPKDFGEMWEASRCENTIPWNEQGSNPESAARKAVRFGIGSEGGQSDSEGLIAPGLASGPDGEQGSGNVEDALYDLSDSFAANLPGLGERIGCPYWLNKEYCGSSTAFDISRMRVTDAMSLFRAESGLKLITPQIERVDIPDITLGAQKLSEYHALVDGIYDRYMITPEDNEPLCTYYTLPECFNRKVSEHVGKLVIEKYTELAHLVDPASAPGKLQAFRDLLADDENYNCFSSLPGYLDEMSAAIPSDDPEKLQELSDEYNSNAVWGAKCAEVIAVRVKEIARQLSKDVSLYDKLADHRKHMTDASAAYEEESYLSAAYHAANVPIDYVVGNLPLFRNAILPDTDAWKDESQRPCSYFKMNNLTGEPMISAAEAYGTTGITFQREQTQKERFYYCRELHREYGDLISELGQIYGQYPALGMGGSGDDRATKKIAEQGETPQGILDYSRDQNRYSRTELKDPAYNGEFGAPLSSCMSKARKDPNDVDSKLQKAPREAIVELERVNETQLQEKLDGFKDQIKDMCEGPWDYARKAIRDKSVMDSFYDCDRKSMSQLFDGLEVPRDEMPQKTTPLECGKRRDMSPLACRLSNGLTDTENFKTGAMIGLQIGMDVLFFAVPDVTGVSKSFATVAASALIGAGIGGGIGVALAPSEQDVVRDGNYTRTSFLLGHGVTPEQLVAADAKTKKAQTFWGNPKLEAGLAAAAEGMVFGVLGSGRLPGARQHFNSGPLHLTGSQLDELIDGFKRHAREGAFELPDGTTASRLTDEAQVAMQLLDENIAFRRPDINPKDIPNLSFDDKLRLLAGELPDGVRLRTYEPDVRPLRDAFIRDADAIGDGLEGRREALQADGGKPRPTSLDDKGVAVQRDLRAGNKKYGATAEMALSTLDDVEEFGKYHQRFYDEALDYWITKDPNALATLQSTGQIPEPYFRQMMQLKLERNLGPELTYKLNGYSPEELLQIAYMAEKVGPSFRTMMSTFYTIEILLI
ncbi:MAG: hypothetical protein HOE90_23025 [Bacteriovoracaceae bacterium]|nr:hypothetical protein [Bacteriovoracaceae bacterium]